MIYANLFCVALCSFLAGAVKKNRTSYYSCLFSAARNVHVVGLELAQ